MTDMELRGLLRDAIEAYHQTGSLRDHADPNDRTGWHVKGIETCADLLCVDALAALRAPSEATPDRADLPCTCFPLFAGHVTDHPDCPRGRAERLDHGKPLDPDATPDRADLREQLLNLCMAAQIVKWAHDEGRHHDRQFEDLELQIKRAENALATPDRADPSEGAEEHCCNDPEHMSPEYLAALRDHNENATPDRADRVLADRYPTIPGFTAEDD